MPPAGSILGAIKSSAAAFGWNKGSDQRDGLVANSVKWFPNKVLRLNRFGSCSTLWCPINMEVLIGIISKFNCYYLIIKIIGSAM